MTDISGKEFVDDYLEHFGILGMHWGIRRTREFLARLAGRHKENKAKRAATDVANPAKAKKRRLSELSDEEIRVKVARMKLEDEYKMLMEKRGQKVKKGESYVKGILKNSGKTLVSKFIEGAGTYLASKFFDSKKIALDSKNIAEKERLDRRRTENEKKRKEKEHNRELVKQLIEKNERRKQNP
jgi:hypothetical protein